MSLRTRGDDADVVAFKRMSRTPARTPVAAAPKVHVDMRWRGDHGIGRYAREVLRRLDVAWRPLELNGNPASPGGSLKSLPRQAREALIYSPGYNSLVRARRQLVTVHDLIHLRAHGPSAVKYHAYYDGVLRPRLRRDGVVITVSESSSRAIAEWLHDDRVRIVNAGNGCSAAFRPDGPVMAHDEPYALYVGNLRAHKNVDVIFEALATLRDVRLKMVVPRAAVGEASTLADTYGIAGRVSVLTELSDEDLAAAYRGAAVTLAPSRYEGFGLSALESIRCGTPVIHWAGCASVSDTVGGRGIATHSPTSAAEWADGIQQLARSGQRVEPPPADKYSWDKTAAIVSDTIRSMAA